MLADIAEKIYLNDYNCAESVLLAAKEAYGLDLDESAFKLVSAFGGGMGCGRICGALAGSMAALGAMNVQARAHATEGFKDLCAGHVCAFEEAFGSIDCRDVKPKLFVESTRCLETVRRAADLLEARLSKG